MIDAAELTSIIGFLKTYKQACDFNGIHENAAVWFVKHFKAHTAATSRAPSLLIKNGCGRELEGIMSSWKEVVNQLSETYDTDDVIAEI